MAVCVSALFGLGAMLALSPATPPRLQELLFGDLLGVDGGGPRWWPARSPLGVGSRCSPGTARSRSSASTAAPRRARRRGRCAGSWRCWPCSRVTTVAAVQGLGNLLLVALVLAPGAAALNLARRLPLALALAAALAALSGVAGLIASFHLGIATGASVALCAVVVAVVALVARPRSDSGPSTIGH